MKRALCLALVGFSIPWSAAFADSEMDPFPWVKSSEGGRFLFKMVPEKWRVDGEKHVIEREPSGVVYRIDREGELVEAWRSEGWYVFDGCLSNDGRYLVGFGPWGRDQENHTDMAIAFYDRGKPLKQYQVSELIKNPDLISYSVSHYTWRPQIQTKPNGLDGETFHLVMIDKTTYSFDITTGEILTKGTDSGARSPHEIRAEERLAAEKKASSLFGESSFKKDYEDHFRIEGAEAGDGKIYGVWFDEPEWRANLIPKKKYPHPCEVEAVFPITGSGKVESSVTAEEIDTALLAVLAHPFVAERFEKSGATGIRMRITGDRLHWDTPELGGHLAKTKGLQPAGKVFRQWAEVIIDEKQNSTAVYVDTATRELIYEDESKWPWEPVILDAVGKRLTPN